MAKKETIILFILGVILLIIGFLLIDRNGYYGILAYASLLIGLISIFFGLWLLAEEGKELERRRRRRIIIQ